MTIRMVMPGELLDFCRDVLVAAGVPPSDAAVTADCLVRANLRGVDSHGVSRLKSYVDRLASGVMNPVTRIEVISESPATALVDGGNGLGQVVGTHAMRMAIEKAKATGIGFVGARNSNHFGMTAYYAMMALPHDMIGIVLSNASPAMAPWGGLDPLLGTNPVAIAVPSGNGCPLVLDMAATVVARGKIRLAARKGQKIPLDWAIGPDGTPTDDPVAALAGSLYPIGGPKGYGWALMVEVLCSALTGSVELGNVKALVDLSGPSGTGHSFCAINVTSFGSVAEFKRRVDSMSRRVRAARKAPGVERIYLPGEIEMEAEKAREKDGIPLGEEVFRELEETGRRYNVGGLRARL